MIGPFKSAVDTIGSVIRFVPAAARIAGDVESGRQPNQQDLRILGLMDGTEL